ncbi:MAG: nucleotidyl transferase AbiEii/AbiGii toxin family protein [Burkholderiales bacterium]
MTAGLSPRLDILPLAQQRLWPELRAAASLGFALYGETAVALRLGHRISVDFDFFCAKPLMPAELRAAFPFMQISTVLQDTPNTLSLLVPYGNSEHTHVKVSFFGSIDFGRGGIPDITNDGVMHIAALDDLLATKVKVILQRIQAKDYRDIAAMLNAGANLSRGLAAARTLFGTAFQPSESLKAMVYFKGGDLHTLSQDEKNRIVEAVSAVRDLPEMPILSHELTAPCQ